MVGVPEEAAAALAEVRLAWAELRADVELEDALEQVFEAACDAVREAIAERERERDFFEHVGVRDQNPLITASSSDAGHQQIPSRGQSLHFRSDRIEVDSLLKTRCRFAKKVATLAITDARLC